MSAEINYGLAFATGIAGAFHCLGMCGTFACGFFIGHGWKYKAASHIAYHGMRILTYVILGVAGALTGRVLAQAGAVGKAQGIIMIIAGLAIVGTGLWMSGLLPWRRATACQKRCNNMHYQNKRRDKYLFLLAGLANGLVPCSLVFSIAIKTLVTDNVLEAALIMLFFGLGTLPTMLMVTVSGALSGAKIKGLFVPLAGMTVMLMGSWTLYEGIIFYDIMRGLSN